MNDINVHFSLYISDSQKTPGIQETILNALRNDKYLDIFKSKHLDIFRRHFGLALDFGLDRI